MTFVSVINFRRSGLVVFRRMMSPVLEHHLARIYAKAFPIRRRDFLFELPDEERKASASISTIIPVHDGVDVTSRCLASLERFGGDAEIVIVDDGSKLDATRELLDGFVAHNGWKLIRHNKALGHSRACEAGAAAATRPILCLLNSDTIVSPRSWAAAVDAMARDSRIAVTGPSTSYAYTRQRVRLAYYCRHHWTDNQIFAFATGYVKRQAPRSWSDMDVISGFAFFIRSSIWIRFGGFDGELSDYGNETELCIRLRKAAYRLVWTKNSYIHHIGTASYSRNKKITIQKRRTRGEARIAQLHGNE